ncbi:MAG: hypothetical protein ABI689_00870 [Thermoanaerobaculia bacterium]
MRLSDHRPLVRRGALTAVLSLFLLTPLLAADGDLLTFHNHALDRGGSNGDAVSGVAAAPDGGVVVVGTVATGVGNWTMALARWLPTGGLDPGFGVGGEVVDPFGPGFNYTGVAVRILTDGRILVAGTMDLGAGDEDFLVGRLLANGAPDPSFATFGFELVAFNAGGNHRDTLTAMEIDGAGRIVLVGAVDVAPTNIDFGIARLSADGVLDPFFSGDGRMTAAVSPASPDIPLAVAIDRNHRILVAGAAWSTAFGGNFDQALVAVLDNGHVDSSFGTSGSVVLAWNAGGNRNEFYWALGVWPDGEIVAAGDLATDVNAWKWTVQRFSSAGTYLSGIISRYCDGAAIICDATPQDSVRALLLQGDGKIVVGGFGNDDPGNVDFGIARLDRNLFPDSSFAGDGTTMMGWSVGTGMDADKGTALAFGRDGRLIEAGTLEYNGLDTDFGWALWDNSYIFADDFEWGSTRSWTSAVP